MCLTVSDFHILIKSCSIESRNDPSPKSEVVHKSPKSEVVHETKFSLKISSGSSGRVRGGPRNMKSMRPPLAAIFFMTYFYRARGGPWPPRPPLDPLLKISYSTHVCLAQLDQHQTCKPVMVSVVSSNPTGGNFIFLRHLDGNFVQKWQKCQICVIYENLDWYNAESWSDYYLHIIHLSLSFFFALKC